MNKKILRMMWCVLGAAVLVILDRVSKIWAVNNLEGKDSIWIIKGALQLYYLPNGNTGAAWGMLDGHQTLFVIIALIVILAVCYIILFCPEDKKYNFLVIMLTFIAAGGIGNMYDRINQKYVVDFIYFSLINFPIFNVADIYVSVCTVLLAFYLIFYIKEEDFEKLDRALKAPLKKRNNNEDV